MKKSTYQNAQSFFGKSRIVLALLGILPFLLAVYMFVYEKINMTDMIVIFSVLALFSILSGFYIIRRFADRLVNLVEQTAQVTTGEKHDHVFIESEKELIDISTHFNAVIDQLTAANKRLKEQSVQLMAYAQDLSESYDKAQKEEGLRNRLSQYVASHLVEKLINTGDGMLFENEKKEVTVLFADIRSFTILAQGMEPEEVVDMLNQFFGAMVNIVFKHNGILDKLVGDQLMAVFGAISSDSHAPTDAIRAALEMQTALDDLMKKRAQQNVKTFEVGIGINTGSTIIGNVGSENRIDYTVIGDCVNTAAGLETQALGGEIIIGEETYRQTKDRFPVKSRDDVFIKNKNLPIKCYSVLR